jgi:hypothetical protein
MDNNVKKLDLKSVVRVLTEYVMLNSTVTDSTSLFYGRSGISLCLFHVARFLDDEFIEGHAYKLLKQSLLNTKNDIRFDTGLSGIGYSLHYAIRNKFIDADFFDVFRAQHEIIVHKFLIYDFCKMDPIQILLQWQIMIYFYYIHEERVQSKIRVLNEGVISFFTMTWETIYNSSASINKEVVMGLWRDYLKVLSIIGLTGEYNHIIEYIHLLQKGFLKKDVYTLYYLSVVCKGSSIELHKEMQTVMREDYLRLYSIVDNKGVNKMYKHPYISDDKIQNNILNAFLGKTVYDIENYLNHMIDLSPLSASLAVGISRNILGLLYLYNINNAEISEILSIL